MEYLKEYRLKSLAMSLYLFRMNDNIGIFLPIIRLGSISSGLKLRFSSF
ncbi:18721_t:CDS:2 [Funneliformis geosporum]|nr:18721_t:CDS:2 [Funneliformis geosporum]